MHGKPKNEAKKVKNKKKSVEVEEEKREKENNVKMMSLTNTRNKGNAVFANQEFYVKKKKEMRNLI